MNKLVYVDKVGQNVDGEYEYDFYFAEHPIVHKEWTYETSGLQESVKPKRYDSIKRVVMKIPLLCLQDNMCFGMQNGVDGVVALAYEDISDYDEYPADGRLVFHYGMKESDICNSISNRGGVI